MKFMGTDLWEKFVGYHLLHYFGGAVLCPFPRACVSPSIQPADLLLQTSAR